MAEMTAYRRDVASDSDSDDEEHGNNMYFLHDIVEQGALERLQELLPPKQQQQQPHDTPVDDHHAMEMEMVMPSMHVLAAETCLLEKDDMGCLPLHVAIIYQRMDCAMHLLRYSEALATAMLRMKCADLNTPLVHLVLRVGGINPHFTTELIHALYSNSSSSSSSRFPSDDLQALLFDALTAKDDEGNSVWHLCAMFNLAEAMQTLLQFCNKMLQPTETKSETPQIHNWLEKGNRLGLRPLHTALKFDSLAVVQLLVEELHVDVNSLTTLQQTPLHVAAAFGAVGGVRALLTASPPADLARVDASGSTALQIATRCQFEDVVRLLNGDSTSGSATSPAAATPRTRFFFHQDSLRHLPHAYHRRGGSEPPPENPERIDTLVDPVVGILRSREFQKRHISWDHAIEMADMADILRVHEYEYVRKIRQSCEGLGSATRVVASSTNASVTRNDDKAQEDDEELDSGRTFVLDPDTALSQRSFDAASRAAGAVCRAVDQVVSGACDNAFCIVRPPGHHAGPTGKVTCCNDPEGSHGFCVFNNVAIGAAYARAHYKRQGINRIAILDFDVHHGNGTEEIVRQLVPSTAELTYSTPYGEGKQIVHQYKPWRNEQDADNVLFCSVHGYGHKDPRGDFANGDPQLQAAWFYPGSGETVEHKAPLILNVGMAFCPEGSSVSRLKWRSSFRDNVLPKVQAFQPDLIFLSAGFDAHKKENVNWGYVALLEQDYEWLVQHVKQVAQSCCQGRLISVLEGGYNFHGRMVSPFARSVAAHARALACPSRELWDEELIQKEAAHEKSILDNYLHPPVVAATLASGASATTLLTTQRSRKKRSTATAPSGELQNDEKPLAKQTPDQEQEPEQPAQGTIAQSRSKRARKHVDYVALAAELEKKDK